MRIGFISDYNPLDRNAFSGTAYYMFHALKASNEVSVRLMGAHRAPNRVLDRVRPRANALAGLSREAFDDLDLLLVLVSFERVTELAKVTDVPIVHCSDATPQFLRDFYGVDVPEQKDAAEREAIEAASLVLYSSDYMKERAIAEIGHGFEDKIAALPWGANLDGFPSDAPVKGPVSPIRLLFIGKDWERKGGDRALAALGEVRRRGLDAELHVVGGTPAEASGHPGLVVHGYLDKNKRSDKERLENLLSEAHLLILPTRADCTPMVVAEANSYGIPVLISEIGGIPSLVSSGSNGFLLPLEATAADYADLILTCMADNERYQKLSQSSHAHFKAHLTWPAWVDSAVDLFEDAVSVQT